MNKVPMTVLGEATLRTELDDLKKVQRPRIVAAIAEARAHGDLKENAEYHAARDRVLPRGAFRKLKASSVMFR